MCAYLSPPRPAAEKNALARVKISRELRQWINERTAEPVLWCLTEDSKSVIRPFLSYKIKPDTAGDIVRQLTKIPEVEFPFETGKKVEDQFRDFFEQYLQENGELEQEYALVDIDPATDPFKFLMFFKDLSVMIWKFGPAHVDHPVPFRDRE